MAALRDNEQAYQEGKEMKTVLVRNKALIAEQLRKPWAPSPAKNNASIGPNFNLSALI